MKIKKGEWIILIFTLIYVIIFSIYYLSIRNYEFIWYILVLLFFVILIATTLRQTNFDYIALWGLSLWGLLHMAGGGIIVPWTGKVLYALEIYRFFDIGDTFILKFDQIVHAFGFGVTTLVSYQILKSRVKKINKNLIYGLCFFISMGAGALNEIVEFIAVIVATETGVGSYYNNSLDLVFNGIGSLITLIFINFLYEK
ncbi:MAG: DUF2238 domain-containing protein [Candidatus Pacearchaeota archaeon]